MKPSAEPPRVERIERETRRLSLVIAIREHPEWTLAKLHKRMSGDDDLAADLRRLTVADLAHEPEIGPVQLEIARRTNGPTFDTMVYRVVRAAPSPIKACDLRARLGGPRWKLQGALGRLVDAGKIERSGNTSNTRYRVMEPS